MRSWWMNSSFVRIAMVIKLKILKLKRAKWLFAHWSVYIYIYKELERRECQVDRNEYVREKLGVTHQSSNEAKKIIL